MSLFDLQDVCIAIGSIATLDLPMVVDLIGIYGLKGPYSLNHKPSSLAAPTSPLYKPPPPPLRRKVVSANLDKENPSAQILSGLLVKADEGIPSPVVDLIDDIYRRLPCSGLYANESWVCMPSWSGLVPTRVGLMCRAGRAYMPTRVGFVSRASRAYMPMRVGLVCRAGRAYMPTRVGFVCRADRAYMSTRVGLVCRAGRTCMPTRIGLVCGDGRAYMSTRVGFVCRAGRAYMPKRVGLVCRAGRAYMPTRVGLVCALEKDRYPRCRLIFRENLFHF
ncbi:hypothetical protein F511_33193 [Dorcoceras hygrometricum]|uniref:Uncharacterized protein n=1 Tax=Dorcoceras hygrometricum TaxID=472368 RepID=A0A2Z7CU79_9LAMI|nr:hypothetical protein F511_33193 [Dorcoceras hygrometricum]